MNCSFRDAMNTSIFFTKAFSQPDAFELSSRQPRPSVPKPRLFSDSKYQGMSVRDFVESPDFQVCQQEYSDLLDRLIDFVKDGANKINPALSQRVVDEVEADFNGLKTHLYDSMVDFFDNHKDVIYGVGKEMFHELDNLIQDEKIPIQKRMNAVTAMAHQMPLCSGGVLTALQNTIASLKYSTAGVKGAAYRIKIQMIDALIVQHIKETHFSYSPGNEVHFINAYYNYLSADMAVPQRIDNFTSIAETKISAENLEACRQNVLFKLNPNALAKAMADDYFDQIKGAQEIDVRESFEGEEWTNVYNRIRDIKQTTLDSEFGDVPFDNYLIPVEGASAYRFSKQSTLISRHFLEALRTEGFVNYDDAISLTAEKGHGVIKMLGDLFWRDHEGSCEELTAKELAVVPASEILQTINATYVPLAEHGPIVHGIAQYIYDAREAEDIKEVSDDLFLESAELFRSELMSDFEIVPVMHLAAAVGSREGMAALLAVGVDSEIRDSRGNTPLITAAQSGQLGLSDLLLQHGADPNLQNERGDSALLCAARRPDGEIMVRTLLEARANRWHTNRQGDSAASLAAQDGSTGTLRCLLGVPDRVDVRRRLIPQNFVGPRWHMRAARAINMPNNEGDTLIHGAAKKGRVDNLDVLIWAGGDVNRRNHKDYSPLMLAAIYDQGDAVGPLVRAGADIRAQHGPGPGRDAFYFALGFGSVRATKALIDAGANCNAKVRGDPAVHRAARLGDVAILRVLKEAGADFASRDLASRSVLMIAAMCGHADAVRFLISDMSPGEVNACVGTQPWQATSPDHRYTALMFAAAQGHVEVVESLISGGAQLDPTDVLGRNALMIAVQRGHIGVAEVLLDNQANVNVTDQGSMTALMLAAAAGHSEMVDVLIKRGARSDATDAVGRTALMHAAQGGCVGAFDLLFEKEASINAQDKEGRTPLVLAAVEGHADMVSALIERGATADLPAEGGHTALMHAAKLGHAAVLEALLEKGAGMDVQDDEGSTALMLAVLHERVESVRTLLAKGADVNVKNRREQTVRDLLHREGNPEILQAFEEWQSSTKPSAGASHRLA